MRPVPDCARSGIKSFEKRVLVCYDSDGAHKPTIGWGSTYGLTAADVGHKTITPEQADQMLEFEMASAAAEIYRQIGEGPVVAMTDNQYGALIMFYFNLGTAGPTLVKLLRAKKFDAVPSEMAKYVYAHDAKTGRINKLSGLVRRRAAEAQLWATDEPGTVDAEMPSGATRSITTPPGPGIEASTPNNTQPGFLTAAATAVGTTAVAAQPVVQSVTDGLTKVHDAIQPYADANPHIAAASNGIMTALAGLAVLTLFLLWLKHALAVHEVQGGPNNVARPPLG